MSQLDLFVDYKPKAQIFTFPPTTRVSLAHAVAGQLIELDYGSGKKLWQSVCRDVRNGLRKDGLTTGEIKIALNELADMVHDRMKMIHIQKQYRPPAVILSMTGQRIEPIPHGEGGGEAVALGQGATLLAGLGGAHEESSEYDAARA